LGPSYETPAEVSYIRSLGGDAVGMSTVPEIQEAAELGMKALGISTITNYAAGIIDDPLSHEDVIKVSAQVKDDFTNLLTEIIKGMVL
jgi:purine-nucleoside phosphorylase